MTSGASSGGGIGATTLFCRLACLTALALSFLCLAFIATPIKKGHTYNVGVPSSLLAGLRFRAYVL